MRNLNRWADCQRLARPYTRGNLLTFLPVLALAAGIGAPQAEAGIVGAISSGAISVSSVTPDDPFFSDFSTDALATAIGASITSAGLGTLVISYDGTQDFGGGNRMILSLTNNTGAALPGIDFSLFATGYVVDDGGIDPSQGTFAANTYTSIPSQQIGAGNNPDVVPAGADNAGIDFIFPFSAGSTANFLSLSWRRSAAAPARSP